MKTKKTTLNLLSSFKNVPLRLPESRSASGGKAGSRKVLKSLNARRNSPCTSKRSGSDGLRVFIGVPFLGVVLCILSAPTVFSHAIHYHVQQKGISVKVFYAKDDPASYSQYELFGPGDTQPHQTGRTDKNGFVSFFPDREGIWKLKVWGESTHGFHGVTIEVKVDQALHLESFSKPLVATHTKLIVGVSLIFGLFGIYSLWRSRRKNLS